MANITGDASESQVNGAKVFMFTQLALLFKAAVSLVESAEAKMKEMK